MVGNRTAQGSRPRATSNPGQEEIMVRIPEDAPTGCFVPLYLQISPLRASNVVTLAIRSPSGRCDPVVIPTLETERIGIVGLFRLRMKSTRPGIPDSIEDVAGIQFGKKNRRPGLLQLPPPGSCMAYTSSFQSETPSPTSISEVMRFLQPDDTTLETRPLDAGAQLTMTHNGRSRALQRVGKEIGRYRETGGSGQNRPAPPQFLDPGTFELAIPGGPDIRAFRMTVTGPESFAWSNRE